MFRSLPLLRAAGRVGLLAGLLALALGGRAAPGPRRLGHPRRPADSTRTLVFERRKLVVQVDSRYSIINYNLCTILGLKLGVEWPGRVRTGAAFYFLSSNIPTRLPPPSNAAEEADATLRFYNVALYGEYILIENRRWELGANLQGGLGAVRVLYNDTTNNNDRSRSPRDFIGLVEPSVAAQLRVFSWASVGAGAGWRQTVFVAPVVRREISGPIFYLRAKILIGPLVRRIRAGEPIFGQQEVRVKGLDNYTRRKL